jgi:hypothetical protein
LTTGQILIKSPFRCFGNCLANELFKMHPPVRVVGKELLVLLLMQWTAQYMTLR